MKKIILFSIAVSICLCSEALWAQHISWQHILDLPGDEVNAITIMPNGTIYATTFYKLLRSVDKGATWKSLPIIRDLYDTPTKIVGNSKNQIFLLVQGIGVERSNDDGNSWKTINVGFPWHYADAIAVGNGDTLYMSGIGGVYRSTNNGDSWDTVGLRPNNHRALLVTKSGTLLAGTQDEVCIYRSVNAGQTWMPVPSNYGAIQSFCEGDENEAFAGGHHGIYRTLNNGESWLQFEGSPAGENYGLVRDSKGILYTSLMSNGLFMSQDNGVNWQRIEGLDTVYTRAFAISPDGEIFLGGHDQGIYRGVITTSVKNAEGHSIPKYTLDQNYPNPFNPSTTISFSLPSRSPVSLKIYDVMGRIVATIVSEDLPAGYYQRQWNASECASGVYIYRLQAGAYSGIKPMLLLK